MPKLFDFEVSIDGEINCTVTEKNATEAARLAMIELLEDNDRFADIIVIMSRELNLIKTMTGVMVDKHQCIHCDEESDQPCTLPYNKKDGFKVKPHRTEYCDGPLKSKPGHTCFRPVYTTLYTRELNGSLLPFLELCRFHSKTDKTEIIIESPSIQPKNSYENSNE